MCNPSIESTDYTNTRVPPDGDRHSLLDDFPRGVIQNAPLSPVKMVADASTASVCNTCNNTWCQTQASPVK
ncbi:MAG: hypothetical protein LBH75_06365 [Treponema sp.]|nr:hypothetical protein [Treponema sp.]